MDFDSGLFEISKNFLKKLLLDRKIIIEQDEQDRMFIILANFNENCIFRLTITIRQH